MHRAFRRRARRQDAFRRRNSPSTNLLRPERPHRRHCRIPYPGPRTRPSDRDRRTPIPPRWAGGCPRCCLAVPPTLQANRRMRRHRTNSRFRPGGAGPCSDSAQRRGREACGVRRFTAAFRGRSSVRSHSKAVLKHTHSTRFALSDTFVPGRLPCKVRISTALRLTRMRIAGERRLQRRFSGRGSSRARFPLFMNACEPVNQKRTNALGSTLNVQRSTLNVQRATRNQQSPQSASAARRRRATHCAASHSATLAW